MLFPLQRIRNKMPPRRGADSMCLAPQRHLRIMSMPIRPLPCVAGSSGLYHDRSMPAGSQLA
jgi:hypothetical protein